MHENQNLFVALREGFPAELDGIAIETADGPGAPLCYTWRDLERATAMIENLEAVTDVHEAFTALGGYAHSAA